MLFSASALLALLATKVHGAIIDVAVGQNNTITFDPAEIVAAAGDTVVFHFEGLTHTVMESSFDDPCSMVSSPKVGSTPFSFNGTGNFPTYNVTINDTSTIWLYCSIAQHCTHGMTAVINEDKSSNQTYASFKAKAMGTSASSSGSSSGSSPSPSGSGTAALRADIVNPLAVTAVVVALGGVLLGSMVL